MSRNDLILYSGKTSASSSRAEREHERALKKRRLLEKQSAIAPTADLISEEVNKIREELQLSYLKLVGPATEEADVKALLVSLNLNNEFINKFEIRIKKVMRATVPRTEEDNE